MCISVFLPNSSLNLVKNSQYIFEKEFFKSLQIKLFCSSMIFQCWLNIKIRFGKLPQNFYVLFILFSKNELQNTCHMENHRSKCKFTSLLKVQYRRAQTIVDEPSFGTGVPTFGKSLKTSFLKVASLKSFENLQKTLFQRLSFKKPSFRRFC